MLPPHRTISEVHPMILIPFLFLIFTPMAFLFDVIIFSTKVLVNKFRLGRSNTGFKKASDALNLCPFLILT